jgi:hypothetical protein
LWRHLDDREAVLRKLAESSGSLHSSAENFLQELMRVHGGTAKKLLLMAFSW